MADTKYLVRRNGIWHIRLARPPRRWGIKSELSISLRTTQLSVAQNLRDEFLVPVLARTKLVDQLRELARKIAEQDDALPDILREMRVSLSGEDDALTWREAADEFLAYLRSSNGNAGTSLRKYADELDSIAQIVGGDRDIESIAKADVRAFRDQALRLPTNWKRVGSTDAAGDGEKRLSASTVKGYLRGGRRLWRWLIDEGRIARRESPFDGISVAGAKKRAKVSAPTPAQVAALCDLPKPTRFAELSWRAFPLIARYTGLRANEVGQLRARDVREVEGVLVLDINANDAKTLKTASSVRLVPVADKLLPHVQTLLAERKRGRLFPDIEALVTKDGMKKEAHYYLREFNKRAKEVGPLSFHGLRNYANTQMANHGVERLDRQAILGHLISDDDIHGRYLGRDLPRLKAAVDRIP